MKRNLLNFLQHLLVFIFIFNAQFSFAQKKIIKKNETKISKKRFIKNETSKSSVYNVLEKKEDKTVNYLSNAKEKAPKASTIWSDDFESNTGWALSGEWQRGAPGGLGGDHGNPDPSSAYQGTNVLGTDLTGLGSYPGDYEANLSDRQYSAISPVIDCSSYSNVYLNFQLWLNVEQNIYDNAYIDISGDNGSNWTNVWSNGGTTISDNAWSLQNIDISSVADGNSQVLIRFAIGTTDVSWLYSGWNIDDLTVTGDLEGRNTITAGATSEPASLSSLIDTQGESVMNFDFTVTDDGGSPAFDGANTLFNELIVKQGTGNDIADWTQAIAGAELSDGTSTISGVINAGNITFSSIADASSGDFGFISDNGNKTYTLKVWLKSSLGGTLPATIDGLNLVFLVDNSSFTIEPTSSGFASGETEDSGASNNAVSVVATQLLFTGQPSTTATSGVALTSQPIVEATDENGNRDFAIGTNVTLSNSGSLNMSNNSMSFTNGLADFGTPNNFMFTTGGKYVMLSATDGSLNSITPSLEIAVDIIGCTIYSEDFNSFTIINDLNGSDGWNYTEITDSPNDWGIEARSGNGNCLTINNPTAFQYDNGNDGEGIAYYNTPIDATNFKNVSISFDWQCDGENNYDWGNILWSTDGTNWSLANTTEFEGQATWTNGTFDLSVADGQQFYIGFKWINDGSVGDNPPFAIDNIEVRGYPKFDYNFSYRQDTYEQITGTIVTLDGQQGANISLPLGFDFQYDGAAVSTVRANENGWLEMGNSLTASSLPTNDLSDIANVPLLAPFWDNLTSDAQTRIVYLVEGTSPARTFTIEWKDALWGGQRENFQVKLYETSYVIEFWYGDMNTYSSGSTSIGINNSGSCMNKLISIIPGTIPTVSYTAENNSINSTTYLNSGLVYIFNPFAMQSYKSWQEATIVVGQPDFSTINTTASQTISAGAYSSSVSSKGVLASTSGSANRVMIWNDIQTSNGAAANVVLGQVDFSSTASGTSASSLDNPHNVCFTPDGNKIIVVDASNNRVLIWNTVPTNMSGAPYSADVVIGQTNFTSNSSGTSATKFNYPTGAIVLPNGKLLISDFSNNRVLVFNQVPTTNGVAADYVIGQPDLTTTSAGTSADKLGQPWDCAFSPDGKLLISDDNAHRILIYNEVPETSGEAANLVIGNSVFGSKAAGSDKDEFDQPSVTVSVEGKIAIADYGNSRVMMYDRIPKQNGEAADFVLGQPDFTSNVEFNDGYNNVGSADAKNMHYPYSICFDLNGRLYVNGTRPDGASGMHRIMVYGDTPTETAELALTIVPTETDVCIYSDAEYTVEVTNNGPDAANSVVVNAQVPVDITATEYDASIGTYNQKSGYWTIPYIAVGQTVTLTFGGEVQPGLAGTNVTAYANIIASKQKDSDFSNNAANAVVAVQVYHAPTTSTEIPDQYINRNGSSGPISFVVADEDAGDLASVTYSNSSSNTTLIPLNYVINLVYAGTAPNKTLDITPTLNEYGYSDMELILTDTHGCHKNYDFKVAVGNIWEGDYNLFGASNTDWNQNQNWSSGGKPTTTKEAIIPTNPIGGYFPIIDVSGAECYDMIIEPKASVTLNNTYSLLVNQNLTIQSDITGTGSLVDYNVNGNITVKGDITVERYISSDAWHYVSTPLLGVSNKVLTENVCGSNYNGNVLDYNEAYSGTNWLDGWELPFATPNTNSLATTNGYAYFNVAGQCSNLIEFTGASVSLNSGSYSYTVTNQDENFKPTGTNPHRGWNLIGNPYPSGLNADMFLSANSSVIDGTVYFWDELGSSGFDSEGSDYAAYNTNLGGVTGTGSGSVVPDQYISCGQAFYVHRTHTDVAGSNVSFTNSMREAENSFFFKKDKQQTNVPKVKLNVLNSQNMYNEIVVGLFNDASDTEINPRYDGYKPEGNPDLSFYSIKDESALLFQGTSTLTENEHKIIPLGIHAGIVGEYTFGANLIEYIPDSIGVFFEDTKLNKIIDLREQNYSVTIDEAGRFNDRFVLHFNINHAPQLINEIADKTINSNEYSAFYIGQNTFADEDFGDELMYSANLTNGNILPSWLTFNSNNYSFSGTPMNDDAGEYPIRVTATDSYGASSYDDFRLTVLSTVNVESAEKLKITVYPNPTNGILYISSMERKSFRYQITDVTGKVLIKTNSNSFNEEVDISSFASGIYFVKIFVGNKNSDYKIFLQK